jgi:preprotein translocase subunit SecE
VNREQKRLLQRQGQIDTDGNPVATARPPSRPQAGGPRQKRGTPLSYFRDVRTELKKVSWPTKQEVRNYSLVVFFTLVVLMALIFVLDFAFTKGAIFLFK